MQLLKNKLPGQQTPRVSFTMTGRMRRYDSLHFEVAWFRNKQTAEQRRQDVFRRSSRDGKAQNTESPRDWHRTFRLAATRSVQEIDSSRGSSAG